jgi:hypothetical protein
VTRRILLGPLKTRGFGLFVRSLVGLERDAAAEAFSRFLDERTYTRAQIDLSGWSSHT